MAWIWFLLVCFLWFLKIILFYVYEHLFFCMYALPGTRGGEKRMLDSMKVELQMVVNQHVGVGNQTRVLSKSSQGSSLNLVLLFI